MNVDQRILKNVPQEDIAEVIEAELETIADEEKREEEYEAYLASLNRHKRYDLKRRQAKKPCYRAFKRASDANAVPPGVTRDDADILAKFELSVALTRSKRTPHSVDHIVSLKGICRKTYLASGVRKHIVCGLHTANNLEVVPLGFNRDIKKDWFDSDWPAWPVEEEEQSAKCQDLHDEADPFGPTPDNGDDKIPF